MNPLEQTVYVKDQTLYGTRIDKVEAGYLIRARIERNAYDFQSRALTEVMGTDRKWEILATYDITELEVAEFTYSRAETTPWASAMKRDLYGLLKRAEVIVNALPEVYA